MLDRITRLLRHRWHDQATVRRALPPAALDRLMQRVHASELRHSGEIRICVEAGLPASHLWRRGELRQIIRERSLGVFGELRVWDTEHNNGVLIYLLLAERAIEIVADRGIDRHIALEDWQAMLARMGAAFREGRFEDGLTLALEEISAILVEHFPLGPGAANPNELPDRPVLTDR